MNRRTFLQSTAGVLAAPRLLFAAENPPLFSFGIAADIQYADADMTIGRHYRDSVAKLQRCVSFWNAKPLSYVIQLGDLVDRGGLENLETILPIFNKARARKHSALGNHDFIADRKVLIQKLDIPAAYYQFKVGRWRFLVLDGMNISVQGSWSSDDPHAIAGHELLAKLKADGAPNATVWNGALGPDQRAWLKEQLADAESRNERVIVFCHFPVLPASCRPETLLWDHQEVLQILESSKSMVAYINGHDHLGGYGKQNHIHYLTVPAIVEHDVEQACLVAHLYENRLVIEKLSGDKQTLEI